jgi:flagellar assembly protein FliH
MSSRAKRIPHPSVTPFDWGASLAPLDHWSDETLVAAADPAPAPVPEPVVPAVDLAQQQAHLAALERDAFAKGFAQGERAGAEVANQRGEAMLRRLTQTLEELTTLRSQMIHQTERQMVQLALAVARRVVRREV